MEVKAVSSTLCIPCRRLVSLISDWLRLPNDGSHKAHLLEKGHGKLVLETSESLENRAILGCKICLKFLSMFDDAGRLLIQFRVSKNNEVCHYCVQWAKRTSNYTIDIDLEIRTRYDGADWGPSNAHWLLSRYCLRFRPEAIGEMGTKWKERKERKDKEGEEGGGNGKGSVTEKIKGKSKYRILSWRPRNCQFLYKPAHPRETNPPVEELGVVTKTQELLSHCSNKDNDKGFDYCDGATQNSNNINSKIAGKNLPLDDLLRHNAICDGCQKRIYGIRYRCLDCADFDLCDSCNHEADTIRTEHRFVPLYKNKSAPRDYQQTFEAINKWLYDCKTTHPASTPPQPRLTIGTTLPRGTSYVTLSHCWGKGEHLQLRRKTIIQFEQGIPFANLSKTFREAIVTTQCLGLRYLWIDSLCIIQDSPEDWQTEANSMSQVYSHSHCTIAAHPDGIFFPDQVGDLRRLRLQMGEGDRTYLVDDVGSWNRGVTQHPLMTRAWVFQERLLSPCNIYFRNDQVFFECSSTNASEVVPFNTSFKVKPYGFFGNRKAKAKYASVINLSSLPSKSFYENTRMWERLVSQYSTKSLSHITDTLTAIGGLASVAQFHTRGGQYLAGHWKNYLLAQLCWFVYTFNHNPTWRPPISGNPRPYTAPSWSWASLNNGPGGIQFQYIPEMSPPEDVAELLSHDMKLVDEKNHFGSVMPESSIVVKGSLARVITFVQRGSPYDGLWALEYSSQVSERGDFKARKACQAIFDSGEPHTANTEYFVLPLIVERGFLSLWNSKLFLEGNEEREDTLRSRAIRGYGIILVAATEKGTFRRWGRVEIKDLSVLHKAIRGFDAAANSSGLEYTEDGKLGNLYKLKLV